MASEQVEQIRRRIRGNGLCQDDAMYLLSEVDLLTIILEANQEETDALKLGTLPGDSEAITTEWLPSVGMTLEGTSPFSIATMWHVHQLRWYESSKSMCLDGESLPGCKTRGDFRTLLRFLKGDA